MSLGRDRTGRRVPTLTEVISPPTTVDVLLDVPAASDIDIDMRGADTAMLSAADTAIERFPFNSATIPSVSALLASVEHDGFVSDTAQTPLERVLADVRRELDAGLDAQLREVLGSAMARAVESVIGQTREELATRLREVIERAVAQELERHRDR